MSLLKQVVVLMKEEFRAFGMKALLYVLFIALFAFNGTTLIGNASANAMKWSTLFRIVSDVYLLMMVITIGQLMWSRMLTRNRLYSKRDTFTKRQAQLRAMPISYQALMTSRIAQLLIQMLFNGFVFFGVFYLGMLMHGGPADHFISFSLLWLGYGTVMNAILTYADFMNNGKKWIRFTGWMTIVLCIIPIVLALLHQHSVYMYSVQVANTMPVLAPLITWGIAVVSLCWLWFGVKKKLVYRDLM